MHLERAAGPDHHGLQWPPDGRRRLAVWAPRVCCPSQLSRAAAVKAPGRLRRPGQVRRVTYSYTAFKHGPASDHPQSPSQPGRLGLGLSCGVRVFCTGSLESHRDRRSQWHCTAALPVAAPPT